MIEFIWWGGGRIATRVSAIRFKKRSIEYLHRLSPDEKYILVRYIGNNTQTLKLRPDDGDVMALMRMGLIYQASHIGEYPTLTFNITPWVKDYLVMHIELLEN